MYRDWFAVKLFAIVFGAAAVLCAIPLFWGVWMPFAGAALAFVLAMVVTVSVTVLVDF